MKKNYITYEIASNKKNFCHWNWSESRENKGEETLFREIIRETFPDLKIDTSI
jgi:hypothetical protein